MKWFVSVALLTMLAGCGKKPAESPQPMSVAADTATPVGAADAAPSTPPSDVATPVEADTVVPAEDTAPSVPTESEFKVLLEQFGDLRILRYRVPGWDALTPQQRVLLYHLAQASLYGRDITWDQKHPQGLRIRKTLEAVDASYKGDRASADWAAFQVYLKRVWFSSGIYHHYSNRKFDPGFSEAAFAGFIAGSDPALLPLGEGETPDALVKQLAPLLFDPKVEPMNVSLDGDGDVIANSANNFYSHNLTKAEVEHFYEADKAKAGAEPVMFGLNSKLVKDPDGKIHEVTWKVGGMYGAALAKMAAELRLAAEVAENDTQRAWILALVKYYETGDLKDFDAFSIAWVKDTGSKVDLIQGFIETYGDALDMRGTYEAIVQVEDAEASARIAAISKEAQWFEDHMPYLPQHKKPNVTGISARVIDTVLGTGDSGPSFPIGVNLPNSDWIRKVHGSKSINIGNIVAAYEDVKKVSGVTEEFAASPETAARLKKYAGIADKLETDMHEVIGHASGQLEEGVRNASDTLKNYASALEEGRADLVALYFLADPKLVELGLVPNEEVARAGYEAYIQNALLVQYARIPLGENVQEAHMRNRHFIAKWAMEKGGPDVIEKIEKAPGKTAFVVKDIAKLRAIFGELLKEVQRIKSQGDFEAGKALVEGYGVQVDPAIHAEVKARYDRLGIAPFAGFVNPVITPVKDEAGKIVDAKLSYVDDFATQMRDYSAHYATLPVDN